MQDKIYKDEMESTCLPLVFPPALKSYLSLSIISDIAMANSGNKNWIMQNFIQLCKYNDSEKIEFFHVKHLYIKICRRLLVKN